MRYRSDLIRESLLRKDQYFHTQKNRGVCFGESFFDREKSIFVDEICFAIKIITNTMSEDYARST